VIAQTFAWHGGVKLEENSAVTNVFPNVAVQPDGGFIVADFRESQVRRYDGDGHLRGYFGRRGDGPREFPTPLTSAVSMQSGDIAVTQFDGTLTLLDSALTEILSQAQSGLSPLYSAKVLSPHQLLLAGRPRGNADYTYPPLLHIWDIQSQRVVQSFFTAPVEPKFARASVTLGIVATAVHPDTIAATFALTDTVFLFDYAGHVLERIRIPFRFFHHIRQPAQLRSGVKARQQWLKAISQVTDLFWLRDGRFVVQYFRSDEGRQEFGLIGLTRSGDSLFEITNVPRLVAIDDTGESPILFFQKPGTEASRTWSIAQFATR